MLTSDTVTSLKRAGDLDSVLIAISGNRPIGFMAYRFNSPEMVELTLSGIDTQVQRRGIYTTLFYAAMAEAKKRRATRAITSTQINNYAVQKAWTRLGLIHEQSYYTLHKWFD